ncbi:MAG: dialkylresorcinol condensing enzyme DarA [Bacteroidota bacterium]|nr:dialkylresorcinol condensing enzyme DarA [Bacteroidota bacterium]
MLRVLVVYYSQSGQLREIVQNISEVVAVDNQFAVDYLEIKMQHDFPFPWSKKSFIGVFPDTFLEKPYTIQKPSEQILSTKYDLIIFGYQPWYLSPSIPANSFLESQYAAALFEGTDVITVIGSRNMWGLAQEKIKKKLCKLKANLVGNITFSDRNPNLVSAYTVVRWMFSGNKKSRGIFPAAGVSQSEIDNSIVFGQIIKSYLLGDFPKEALQTKIQHQGGVEIKHFLIQIDKTANKIFRKWANLIDKKSGNDRELWLNIFYYYLIFVIWFVSPIVYVFYILLYPLRYKAIKRELDYYKRV